MSGPRARAAAAALLVLGLGASTTAALWSAGQARSTTAALAAATQRVRDIDGLRQQRRLAPGDEVGLQARADEVLRRADGPEERLLLETARSAALRGDARAMEAALDQAEALQAAALGDAYRRADTAWRWLPAGLGVGAALAAAAVWLALRRKAPPQAADSGPLVDLLRSRLDDLYDAQAKLKEGQRFAVLGEIAAGLSHGLKTPLASIRAAAQVAQAKLPAGAPALTHLDDVIAEADDLTEQVQRFLRLFKDMSSRRVAVDAGRLLGLLDERYRADAAARRVLLAIHVDPATPTVQGDPALLEVALRNLVENALMATPAGKTVTLRAGPGAAPKRAGLDQLPPAPGEWMELRVEDEGPGLSSSAPHRPGETTRQSGSGLGIALTRRLVGRHGGAVTFERREPVGTAARVLLPCTPPSLEEAEA